MGHPGALAEEGGHGLSKPTAWIQILVPSHPCSVTLGRLGFSLTPSFFISPMLLMEGEGKILPTFQDGGGGPQGWNGRGRGAWGPLYYYVPNTFPAGLTQQG